MSSLPTTLPEKMQRRRSLRAYQRELAERTRAACAAPARESSRLAVQAGQTNLLFKLNQTGEVLPLPALTRVAQTKPWFLGLTQCRGNLVGVIDLAGFLGQPVAAPAQSDRLLIVASSLSVHCAMRVSRVLGLLDVSAMTLQPAQAGAPEWTGIRYRDSAAASWTELDLAALLQAPAFLDISQ